MVIVSDWQEHTYQLSSSCILPLKLLCSFVTPSDWESESGLKKTLKQVVNLTAAIIKTYGLCLFYKTGNYNFNCSAILASTVLRWRGTAILKLYRCFCAMLSEHKHKDTPTYGIILQRWSLLKCWGGKSKVYMFTFKHCSPWAAKLAGRLLYAASLESLMEQSSVVQSLFLLEGIFGF